MKRTLVRPPGRLNLPPLGDLWGAREVMIRFGMRDLVLRYRQTALGVIWVLLQPIASAGILALVFGSVAKLPSGGTPYFLFSFAGMLAWNVVNSVVSRAAPSLVANQALVSKVFFPRVMVPLASVVTVVLDFAVGFLLLVVLLVLFGVNPGWQVTLVPVWLLFALLLSTGVGIALSAAMVRYRDVAYVLPWLLQILLYATPIAYSISAVPSRLRWLFEFNPLSWLMEIVRWTTLGQSPPPLWQLYAFPASSVTVFIIGFLIFHSTERSFADFI